MQVLDYVIVGIFGILVLIIGIVATRRAGKTTDEFFLAGRRLPWYLSGLSMLATNFASDTPLAVSGFARKNGILGAWYSFSFYLRELTIGFFFARLWRRSGVVTDVEFYELRHGPMHARILRSAVGAYNSLLFVPIKLGLFTLAMRKLLAVILPVSETTHLLGFPVSTALLISAGLVFFALLYSASAGLWGVVLTDAIEFVFALVGSYVLTFYAIRAAGGLEALTTALPPALTRFAPTTLLSPVLILLILPHNWLWDGDLAVAQRLMACRNEKEATLAQLMRTFVNLGVRSWPWIITGMASLIVLNAADLKYDMDNYPMMMQAVAPIGILGIVVASFIGAYLSSVDTYLNLGSAYFVNDLYRRFFRRGKSDAHYLLVSRLATGGFALITIVIAASSDSIFALFGFVYMVLAGLPIIRSLRWFWWRINGWAELAAFLLSGVFACTFELMRRGYESGALALRPPARWLIDTLGITEPLFPDFLYLTVDINLVMILTTGISILIAYLTPPDPTESLSRFYRRVRPAGPGWRAIRALNPDIQIVDRLGLDCLAWILGIGLVFGSTFAIGALWFHHWGLAIGLTILTAASGVLMKVCVFPYYNEMNAVDRSDSALSE
ncbi:MAG: Na+:solute symporter [Candidatus Marinimicrobia bacterium]|nr:Na+:solute symporter [Candidatus Neomarinimicrobiota bacterium]